MAVTIQNIVDTNMKNIRVYRDVHKTSEVNAYIEEAEKQAELKEALNQKGDVKIENERGTNKRIEKKKDDQADKQREAKKAFEEVQKKLLSTPSPPPLCYGEIQTFSETVFAHAFIFCFCLGGGVFI